MATNGHYFKKYLVGCAKQCAKVGGWDPNQKGLGGGTVVWSILKPVRHTPLLPSMRMKYVLLSHHRLRFSLS